jgi:hypothetical protein
MVRRSATRPLPSAIARLPPGRARNDRLLPRCPGTARPFSKSASSSCSRPLGRCVPSPALRRAEVAPRHAPPRDVGSTALAGVPPRSGYVLRPSASGNCARECPLTTPFPIHPLSGPDACSPLLLYRTHTLELPDHRFGPHLDKPHVGGAVLNHQHRSGCRPTFGCSIDLPRSNGGCPLLTGNELMF